MQEKEMPYRHWNPLVKFYFNGILKKAVRLAKLEGGEKILDFGCQGQELKKFLPKSISYTGFDVNPKYSDLNGFSGKKFDTIFALNVLEHLDEKELRENLGKFRATGAKRLLVSLPTEHAVGKLLALLHGYAEKQKHEHKANWKKVEQILGEEFALEKRTGFFTMQKMSSWLLN